MTNALTIRDQLSEAAWNILDVYHRLFDPLPVSPDVSSDPDSLERYMDGTRNARLGTDA
ncbi:hypothetical protein [Hyphomicrobium sp.]|uniref:hypothetical protein n=1 Tax=Hyphomicrobium sp. TaxID=82 RepID=UPI002E381DD5|nr:hypothetical protein [Hyphomicrobium sp.]HEX2842165.1 hypothetical protein [Hyphomicrobium sp.]